MALMTACPKCQAHFKIVPDQLKLHGGLVRCGACTQVFDASKALLTMPTQIPELAAQTPVWHAKSVIQAIAALPKSNPISPPTSIHNLDSKPISKPIGFSAAKARNARQVTTPVSAAQFVAPDESLKRHDVATVFYALLIIILFLCAVVQIALLLRYALVQAVPTAKPLLAKLCEVSTQCTLEPAKTINHLHLEVLTLKRISQTIDLSHPAEYELVATVRSTSVLTVLAPNIELSLSNAQTQTIARRVLTSTELMPLTNHKISNDLPTIAPFAEWEIKGKLNLDPNTLGFTGRLVLAE